MVGLADFRQTGKHNKKNVATTDKKLFHNAQKDIKVSGLPYTKL